MQRLEVSGVVRLIYGSLGVKRLTLWSSYQACALLIPAALLNVLFSFCSVCHNTCIFIHHSAVHTCLLLVVLDSSIAAWTWGKYIRAMDFHFWHMGSWAWIKCVWYERKKESCSTICNKQSMTRQGTRWRSWLRHCATSQKVAGSIPFGVNGSFHWHNPSSRTMALGSTQPLTEMSIRNISWG
jgi:hypothetical protein